MKSSIIGRWFRDYGVRETIESLLVALVLALLFRAFEAEAFIIPTGSMAPSLQGRHIDVACPECGYRYQSGARLNSSNRIVQNVVCPICQYRVPLEFKTARDHQPFNGDRILVNKFVYDFQNPKRWDVIVFKYPNNGKQNFIKRLVLLPGESGLIECGDIYTYRTEGETFADRTIARKSPDKLWGMLQIVDDTHHISRSMRIVDWPSRWDEWESAETERDWQVEFGETKVSYSLNSNADDTQWLRYRHLRPRWFHPDDAAPNGGPGWPDSDWNMIKGQRTPRRFVDGTALGELITDYYTYNEQTAEYTIYDEGKPPRQVVGADYNSGMHWVGDLALRADVEIVSSNGELWFEVVEGGVAFRCMIDVETGVAQLSSIGDGNVQFINEDGSICLDTPTATTQVKGAGKHQITFANADDKLFLWVDGNPVDFTASMFSREGDVLPSNQPGLPSDAEPVGIGGAQGVELHVSRLQVLRDIYYTSPERGIHGASRKEYRLSLRETDIREIICTPSLWSSEKAKKLFQSRKRNEDFVFRLNDHQFFPMGDNSPSSSDARIWEGEPFVDTSYLLGQALFVYWPHAKTKPFGFFPDFGRMRFIR